MKFKKITAMLCTAAMALSIISLPAAASTGTAENTVKKVVYVNDNFEDGDVSDWYFRENVSGGTEGTKSVTVVEENGNKFMRVAFTGTHVDGDGKVLMFSKKFSDGIFDMEEDGITVIEFKTRTNSKVVRKQFKFNYPTEKIGASGTSGNIYNEYGYNTRAVATFHSTGDVLYAHTHNSSMTYQGNMNTLTQYSVDTWYRIKMVMDRSAGKMYITIYNDDATGQPKTTGAKIMSAWWFDYYDNNQTMPITDRVIEDFSLLYRNAVTMENDYTDIDDFKIYRQVGEISGEVIPNTDIDIIYRPESLSVKLDAPVTINEGAIKLVDEAGLEIPHTPSFDEATLTYTAELGSVLPAGNYKFVIDPSKAVPVNETDGLLTQIGFKSDELPFVCYDTMPPSVSDTVISGRVIPGTVITASYTYSSEKEEGESVYEWYMADSADDVYSKIENASFKELEVTDSMLGKYIKFKVTPFDIAGLAGMTYESNAIIPEVAPTAENVKLSSNLLYTGSKVIGEYVFSDANGDDEGQSEKEWYVSDNGTDGWQLLKTGDALSITDEIWGKYVKFSVVPVANSIYESRGVTYESAAAGPVSDIITASNLFVNADFESGDISPWIASASTGYQGVAITDEEAYRGTYSMRAYPRPSITPTNGQEVALEAGKMYILSAMVKSASGNPHTNFEGQVTNGSTYRPYRTSEYTEISPDEWVRVTLTVAVNTSTQYRLGFKSDHDLTADAYIDDAYVGELRIGDIGTKQIAPVTIPKGDEKVSFSVLDGKIYNQLGETDGLTEQTAILSVEGVPGVSIVNDMVVVDSSATAGTITVKATVVPKFTYNVASGDAAADIRDFTPAQSEFVKEIPIELVAHNDKTPIAKNVDATGTVVAGNTLTGAYEFYQVDGKTDASDIRWMYSDTLDGTFEPIPGATGMTYVVGSAYADKFIKFEVTPKTDDGLVGTTVSSVVLATPTAPYVENITVSGVIKVGETLAADYDFVDVNRDNQGDTKFQWYVSDTADGVYSAIDSANTKSLELTADLTDKYIKLGVTPVSEEEPAEGDEAFSKVLFGPTAPVAKDATITVEGNRLIGNYTYYHPHNARELKSIYKWTVDGNVVSDDTNYVANFAGTKTVTFTVTPVGDTNPGTGKSVSVSAVITVSTGSVGGNTPVSGTGGGGGGGSPSGTGGGGIAAGVTSINNLNYGEEISKPEDTEPEENGSDLDGHWGEEYIKKMEERGVMGADENGNYNPDELVSRESMLTYLFKTLKLEASEYTGIFGDVADGEFAGMLQTMVDNGTIAVDDNFRPGDSISREEMCKILFVSLDNAGKLVEEVEDKISGFADYGEISEWARHYVNSIYAIRIMIGVSDDRFAPQENVTKAQAATMLTRIISWIEGE